MSLRNRARRSVAVAIASAALTMLCMSAFAQDAAPEAKPFKEEELASLLAPIALYPDAVVTQILIASTYPLEVVEASRWLGKNSSLTGEALAKEAQKQAWDASVQALTAMPDVLAMMDEKLDWTQKVGDAFLAQQKDVMDMVQQLRAQAKAAGNLASDEHMTVKTEQAPATADTAAATPTQVIVIESADPEVIYVPTYSPVTVYGSWGYPSYPPYYWPPPVGYPGSGFWWGVGIGISIGYWGGHYNNCYPDWHGGDINIGEINVDRGDRTNISGGNRVNTGDRAAASATQQKWSHDPEHRKGASYRDSTTASKYNRSSSPSAGTRDAYRGRTSTAASTPSRGTRDLSSGASRPSPSTGARDLGGGGSITGSGTRPSTTSSMSGSSSRGSTSSHRSSSSSAFGGMSSGSRASSYGSRGGTSRGGGGRRR
jgi:hypothetical protein